VATTPSVSTDTEVTIRSLLEAGLHFGHQTKRWNPKMKRFIFDKRNGIHIIDLAKSLTHLKTAGQFLYEIVVSGRSVLFVGTKKQAQAVVKEAAERTGQHYVTTRWLGGMLTNNRTIRRSVARLHELEKMETDGVFEERNKKEVSRLRHELQKLQRNLSGVAKMDSLPGAIVVIDVTREAIAVAEGNRMQIPVVALVDTCCSPELIDYPIPGNDDAIRAITLIVNTLADSIQKGNEEYSRVAAELAKKKAEEEAKAKQREKEAEEKRKAREAADKKAKEAAAKAASKGKPKAEAKPKKPKAESKPEQPEKAAKAAASATGKPKPEQEASPAPKPAEELPKEAAAKAAPAAATPEAPAQEDPKPQAAATGEEKPKSE